MGRWIFGWICLVFTWPLLAKDFLNTNIAPEWSSLDSFQNRINRTDFEHLITKVYCPRATWRKGWVELKEKEVWIRKSKALDDWYKLSFGDGNQTEVLERNQPDPITHEYAISGTYYATIRIYNDLDCRAELTKPIKVGKGYSVLSPNVFTPNGDIFNQCYKPLFNGFVRAASKGSK